MRVLIIGSLAGPLASAARIAIARGLKIEQADTIEGWLSIARPGVNFDFAICDIDFDCRSFINALESQGIMAPVVSCGFNTPPDRATRAISDGAHSFLPLPVDAGLFSTILESLCNRSGIFVARDPSMLAVLMLADQVAPSDASLLIMGESGTGKEVLAQYIHRNSRRSAGPFVALNCAAIPENLLESELFGHEKGAFSGAVGRRLGKFEIADGGTLLLDEISEMDIRLQAKLLRAVQEREIDRLGGTTPVHVNVRILATTNRNLIDEVEKGNFREDLYFRLNVISLHMPPLRERPADIELLAAHFADKYADLNGLRHRPLSANAKTALQSRHWRGNVRELENTMHRAVLLSCGPVIDADAVTPEVTMHNQPPASRTRESNVVEPPHFGSSPAWVARRMDDVERDFIIETLHHTFGNRTHAATILGISIRALRNKLRDYAAQGTAVPPPQACVSA